MFRPAFICFLLLPWLPLAKAESMDFSAWGKLAIQDNDRSKPIDTFAEESLIRLSGKALVKTEDKTWIPNEWVLSMLLDTHAWADEPLILISHRPLVERLKLDTKQKRFSFNALAPLQELKSIIQEAHELRREEKTLSREQIEAENVGMRLTLFTRIADGSAFLLVPPAAPADSHAAWLTPPEAKSQYPDEKYGDSVKLLQGTASHYLAKDSFQFNLHANQLRQSLRSLNPDLYPSDRLLELEYIYNHADTFEYSIWFYGCAFFLLLVQQLKPVSRRLVQAALALTLIGFLLNASGLIMRCLIAGRPPVTNMYESIVWVAFGAVAFGLIFLLKYRVQLYLLSALPVAILCLLLVHQIPVAMPSRLDPLVPVLRSNFWLTIHVMTITLSYSAFFLAMAFGHIVLLRYIRNPRQTQEDSHLHFWLYRIMQIGVLLIAAGTILGGVWANYSWGRFWGWDPKETWALIVLLCYIFTIHGRLAGWWGKFGLALGSVVCFMSVIMAWYGVNFVLGVGLHSYGFGLGGEEYVLAFLIADALFVALACWRYRQGLNPTPSGN